jgi:hypothetical protein
MRVRTLAFRDLENAKYNASGAHVRANGACGPQLEEVEKIALEKIQRAGALERIYTPT